MSDAHKDAESIESALKATANFLSKIPNASKDLLFVANSIEKYLALNDDFKTKKHNGDQKAKKPTLDHAFGLNRGKGRYDRPFDQFHLDIVLSAIKMLDEKKYTWLEICERIGYEKKEMERLYKRYKTQAYEKFFDENITRFDIDPFT